MENMQFENAFDKERREAAKRLIDEGADYTIGGINEKMAEKLKREHEANNSPDLSTYIKLNKVLVFKHEDMPDSLKNETNDKKGLYFLDPGERNYKIIFIDSQGSIADFIFDAGKIESFVHAYENEEKKGKSLNRNDIFNLLDKELRELGFTKAENDMEFPNYYDDLKSHNIKLAKKEKTEKQNNFDF
jgi:hypothetical protein